MFESEIDTGCEGTNTNDGGTTMIDPDAGLVITADGHTNKNFLKVVATGMPFTVDCCTIVSVALNSPNSMLFTGLHCTMTVAFALPGTFTTILSILPLEAVPPTAEELDRSNTP